jgi:anti-anti-sigma factor
MPVEKWSDSVLLVHLADDPQFTDDLEDLEEALALGESNAVLDFAPVQAINSSNLARLLKLRKQQVQRNKQLIVCNIASNVHHTFLVTGLDNVFEISENVATALATLQMTRH